jgi:hypothetical protein
MKQISQYQCIVADLSETEEGRARRKRQFGVKTFMPGSAKDTRSSPYRRDTGMVYPST